MDASDVGFMEGAKLRLYLIPKRIYLKSEPTNSWRHFRSREYTRAAVLQNQNAIQWHAFFVNCEQY